jgi:hypothetical protein
MVDQSTLRAANPDHDLETLATLTSYVRRERDW